ncbi:sporulation histidine kinase inhibitor Sda [Paenibacillus eucommiae]|uniref:sporulation histidine kinase inhibitor Sda n=1 Tax=Paenibacillus eucommiae TaxID=1355755 RepID=UPI001AE8823E
MPAASRSLRLLPNDHLIECFRLAAEMELDPEFVLQLQGEMDKRKLASPIHQSQLLDGRPLHFKAAGSGI